MMKFSRAPESQNESLSAPSLDAVYTSLYLNRKACGLPTTGLGTEEVCATSVGLYGPTEKEDLDSIISALGITGADQTVLDLGSGIGKLILPLVERIQNIKRAIGIEFDAVLYEQSIIARNLAEKLKIIKPGQACFFQGDFFSSEFTPYYRQADRIFYYLSSSNDESRLGEYLAENMVKPGARFVAYGDKADPFPVLKKRSGITWSHCPESLINIYAISSSPALVR